MAHSIVHRLACLVILLAVTSTAKKDQSRWSRQISTYTADISDWVPLSGPVERDEPLEMPQIKRQAVAEPRILSEPFPGLSRPTGFAQDTFPSRTYFNSPSNRQLYLQSVPAVPSAPQNYLSDQGFGQNIRFGLSQSNFPLSQGFVAPQFGYDSVPQIKPRPQVMPLNPVKFESFPKPIPAQTKPFGQTFPTKPEAPKYIDGYRAENASDEYTYTQKKRPQSLQKIKFENVEKPKSEGVPKVEREEVQLLYVPLESLNRGQFNFRSPITSAQLMNPDLYSQGVQRPNQLKQSLAAEFQRPAQKPVESFSPQDYFSNFNAQVTDTNQVPTVSTITTPFPTAAPTTPKPKKLKPHQPPLAIFLSEEARRSNNIKVGDVLASLKNADTIAVLDSVNPLNAPSVFIGPSTLNPPERYVKFELPYLSNIENSDKKLRQLPFFVAPLSYNTPQGFAKIPFPSPHVGSVVINSQIKDTQTNQGPSTANVKPKYYTGLYKSEQKPVTQKPSISFYSTVPPKPSDTTNRQPNYYSFEAQMVSSLRTPQEPDTVTQPPKAGTYFMNNIGSQYNSPQYVDLPIHNNYDAPEPVKQYTIPTRPNKTPTTTRATTTTHTTAKPSTYPSQLLETHNPYSINQAFHFSTPLDYHSYFDDFKEPSATPAPSDASPPSTSSPRPESTSSRSTTSSAEIVTEKQKYYQVSPNYMQNYSPEIHYESDSPNSRYPVYNNNEYTTKVEPSEQSHSPIDSDNNSPVSSQNPNEFSSVDNQESQSPVYNENLQDKLNDYSAVSEGEIPSRYEYNQYETNSDFEDNISTTPTSTTTTTTTTTTRRTPLRTRGRPRYTTPRTDSNESTTRYVATRRPLRERRPLPTRPRYEPNKITTEQPTRKPIDSSETSTKSTRTRTRGRITFRPTENDETYERKTKGSKKEADLAYQRDVLHQNYPVTLMERMSTVDIEAITEPEPKISSTKDLEPITDTYDTENAYTNEKAAFSQHNTEPELENPNIPTFTSRTPVTTETPYVPNLSSNQNDEYVYQSRSSLAPVASFSYDEADSQRDEDSYGQQTTPVPKENSDIVSFDESSSITEQKPTSFSISNEFSTVFEQEATTVPDEEETKIVNDEDNQEITEEEENTVQTTPSYNRVRVRPGVIRQYHQASSTESTRVKTERRRPVQAITYRPAFDRRRTTMRIEEIEADLKTKQVHARPEQDYRHPVYKPEPASEFDVTTPSTHETTTKRGHFRRRRPSYTTTSTEASARRNTYEVKNRFRGRRPTEKITEKPEIQTEATSTTVRPLYSRYSHRPRLSERYTKKPDTEETEDQESNYSISRPKYVEPENEQWSPKITSNSFRPYNPNNIVDDHKIAITERKSDKDSELDIITARNEYDDILISVTPATNNRNNKKIPDIPPTLEALVEQSKVTNSYTGDSMSTFESMLEEVMKSLEEQDEDEYTNNVMKHKGGEIGEIPPERIISSGDVYTPKSTTPIQQEITTVEPAADERTIRNENENDRKSRRRGFWKKVKVRPVTTESIEVAESQYYTNTVNRLGQPLKQSKNIHDKTSKYDKTKVSATTYKPKFQVQDIFGSDDEELFEDILPTVDISKINAKKISETKAVVQMPVEKQTTIDLKNLELDTERTSMSPGDYDLGTGSPDPTIDDMYYTTPTEPTTKAEITKPDTFSFMDYLFGVTSEEEHSKNATKTTPVEIEITTEQEKSKTMTTESTYIPEEITEEVGNEESTENIMTFDDIKKVTSVNVSNDEKVATTTPTADVKIESSSVSSFMGPENVVRTSMSTEISHETEICFRGKCIKSSKVIV